MARPAIWLILTCRLSLPTSHAIPRSLLSVWLRRSIACSPTLSGAAVWASRDGHAWSSATVGMRWRSKPWRSTAVCPVDRAIAREDGHACPLGGQGLLRRVTHDHREGVQPYEQHGASCARITPALGRRLASVCHGPIAWSQGARWARLARRHSADAHLVPLERHQVHREVQARGGPGRSRGLQTSGVEDHKAPSLGSRGTSGHREQPLPREGRGHLCWDASPCLGSSWVGSVGVGWVSASCCTGWSPPSTAGWRRSVASWPRGWPSWPLGSS